MWQKYFKVINIVPGRVVVPGHGTIDFSRSDLPLEMVKELYENDFPYLDITEEGKEVIYNIVPKKETPEYFTTPEKIPAMETEKPKRKRRKKKPTGDA